LQTNRPLNALTATVYIDFENVYTIFVRTGKEPLKLDFFRMVKEKLRTEGLTIIDFIVYGNFECTPLNKLQTSLRKMGLQTRHSAGNGKNCSDMELTVDVLKDLYKNKYIEVFVIISINRNIIPLVKTINAENRLSYVFSTKDSFNPIVTQFSSFYAYIEDLLDFGSDLAPFNQDQIVTTVSIDQLTANPKKIEQAREVTSYFYNSNIWKKSFIYGEPVRLKGYIDAIIGVVKRSANDIINDFKLAHTLKYVTLYSEPNKGLCIKAGERFDVIKALQTTERKKGKN
jgi:hypothetical protein